MCIIIYYNSRVNKWVQLQCIPIALMLSFSDLKKKLFNAPKKLKQKNSILSQRLIKYLYMGTKWKEKETRWLCVYTKLRNK